MRADRAAIADRLCDALDKFDSRSLTTAQLTALTVMLESFGDQSHVYSKAPALQLIPGGVA